MQPKTLETIRDETTDLYEEQRAVDQLEQLYKKPAVVNEVTAKIKELETQIAELQAADRIKYEEKVTAAQLKFQASRSPTLELTGIATFVTFTSTQD